MGAVSIAYFVSCNGGSRKGARLYVLRVPGGVLRSMESRGHQMDLVKIAAFGFIVKTSICMIGFILVGF